MRGLAVIALGAVVGCIEPELVLCASGLACPVGARCDEIHHTCVSPEQFLVCEGEEDNSDCTAGPVSGGCFDGVCLARGCGNRVVETGEMCDDGNQISLDGCRDDCLSTEICGNGFLDPDELCDDGDLISRDGCDSRCQAEEAAWSVIPIAPSEIDHRVTAYDAARGRLVAVAGGTWEWDGTRWTVHPSALQAYAVFYDSDRGEVRMVSPGPVQYEPEPRLPMHVHAWRGGEWVQISRGDEPNAFFGWIDATYDGARNRLFAIEHHYDGPETLWTIDSTGTWTRLAGNPDLPGNSVLAFDPVTGHVLLESDFEEWVYDGTGWTSSPTSFSTVSMAFDPARGHLVLVNHDRTVWERIGTEWQAIPAGEMTCNGGRWAFSPLYYNPTTATLELFSRDAFEICRWSGVWTSVVPDVPSRVMGATYDALGRSFVLFETANPLDPAATTATWTLAGESWSRLETSDAPVGRRESMSVYSPGRATTVLYGGYAPFYCEGLEGDPTCQVLHDAWSFDGAAWAPIASPPLRDPSSPPRMATYDGKRRRILLGTTNEIWSLADTASQWSEIHTDLSSADLEALAWDARNDNFLVIRRPPGSLGSAQLFDFGEDGWARIELIPSVLTQPEAQVTLMSDPRRGGVLAIEGFHGFVWERVGSTWVELPPLPLSFIFPSTAYNPVDGSVLVVGKAAITGRYAAILRRTSPTPLESCIAGQDLDGDGLAGCDDQECFWACSSCLPHTNCP